MKNKTYYLGKMKYHKRNTDFELTYLMESNIKNFSFKTEYKQRQEKIPDQTYLDSYLIKMDELGFDSYVIFLKSINDRKMYFLPIEQETAKLIIDGEFESSYIGDNSQFILELSSVRNFDQITN